MMGNNIVPQDTRKESYFDLQTGLLKHKLNTKELGLFSNQICV